MEGENALFHSGITTDAVMQRVYTRHGFGSNV
jgi:hypothetical protein